MRRHLLILLIATALLAPAIVPAQAATMPPGITDCESVRTAPGFGVFMTGDWGSTTPYGLCTKFLADIKDPVKHASECLFSNTDAADICMYTWAAALLQGSAGMAAEAIKQGGEVARIEGAGGDGSEYKHYIRAISIVMKNSKTAIAPAMASLTRLQTSPEFTCGTVQCIERNKPMIFMKAVLNMELGSFHANSFASTSDLLVGAYANPAGSPGRFEVFKIWVEDGDEVLRDAQSAVLQMKEHLATVGNVSDAAPKAPQGVDNPIKGNVGGSVISLPLPLSNISVSGVIGRVINGIVGIVGAVALLMFVWGGMQWMLAAGDSAKVGKAKQTLVWSTLGLLAIFSSYVILSFVINAFKPE